ncbi:MAG: DUF2953 domain-containing protein [Peptococcaceae bacterium]|nr:DUF2953 domain-containing protein [Peptococcaceae bacterium]
MKITAFITVCVIWLAILLLIKLKIYFTYRYHNLESYLSIELQVLLVKTKIEIHISRDMFSLGLMDLLNNLVNDMQKETLKDKKPPLPKSRRYLFLKKVSQETKRHYFLTWPGLKSLKKKLSAWKHDFFKKVNIYSFHCEIQIGTEDAARTGLLAGSIGAMCGMLKARCIQNFRIKSNNIFFNVIPRFDASLVLCRLNCILSLKISHIIFTAGKLLIIMKNRRARNYG